MTKIQPIILAAGQGKRIIEEAVTSGMGELPKVLYLLNGKPLIDYVLNSVAQATTELVNEVELLKPIVVVKFMQEKVREHLGDSANYVEQNPAPLGTGHAVLVTESAVPSNASYLLVLNGDMPAWHSSTMVEVVKESCRNQQTLTLATVNFTDPQYSANFFAYGRLVRDGEGQLVKIVEQRDATAEELAISECNPSLYCFERQWAFSALHELKNDNSQQEYYLTDLLALAIEQQQKVGTVAVGNWREALGVNTLDQLKLAEELL